MKFKDYIKEDTLDDLLGAFSNRPVKKTKPPKGKVPKDFHKFKEL